MAIAGAAFITADNDEGPTVAFATDISVVERLAPFDQTPMAAAMSNATPTPMSVRMDFSYPCEAVPQRYLGTSSSTFVE
jgi:hypothetical protein